MCRLLIRIGGPVIRKLSNQTMAPLTFDLYVVLPNCSPAVNRLVVRLCIRKRRITNAIEEINFYDIYFVQNDPSIK